MCSGCASPSGEHRERRRTSRSEHKAAGAHRPAHPLGPRVVLAVPDVPAAAGRPARRAAPPARGRPVLRPLPARRADGGGRRLPRRPPRGRADACARLAATGPAGDGPVVRPARRVPRVGRDARAQPAARPRAWPAASAAPWRSATCPTCSATSPRCRSCSGQFGFEHAVVWRGVPVGRRPQRRSGGRRPTAPRCGPSTCPQGYGNGALVPDDAKALVRRIGEFEEEQGDLLTGPILWMNGTDHLMPQPWLGRVVAEANDLARRLRARTSRSLAEHLRRRAHRRAARRGTGELRSGRPRQPAHGRGVEPRRREAGRRRAPSARSSGWPSRCPRCSCPPTAGPARCSTRRGSRSSATAPTTRSAPARSTRCATPCSTATPRPPRSPTGLTDRALHALGATIGVDGRTPVIVNPSHRTRSGVVELRLRGADVPAGHASSCRERPAEWMLVDDTAVEVATVMVGELEYVRNVLSFTVLGRRRHRAASTSSREPAGTLVTPPVRRAARRAAAPSGPASRCACASPRRPAVTVLAHVADVAGLRLAGVDAAHRSTRGPGRPPSEHRLAQRDRHGRGRSRPTAPSRSTATRGLGRLVDGGDVGRHLQLVPARPTTSWSTRPTSVVDARRSRPGRCGAGSRSRRTYDLPDPRRRTAPAPGRRPVEVLTTLELRAGDDLVRVHVELDNHGVRDHRLRVRPPAPRAGRARRWPSAPSPPSSAGSSPRAVPPSRASPPSRRAASSRPAGSPSPTRACSSTSWSTSTTPASTAGALALTLLRCTGMLSQGPMATRPLPGRPADRRWRARSRSTASRRASRSTSAAAIPYAVVDDAFAPAAGHPRRRRGGRRARPPARRSSITGAEVSAVVREAGQLHRAACSTRPPTPTTVTIDGRAGWLVDLRGRPVQPFEGSFDLTPWQIATVNLGD